MVHEQQEVNLPSLTGCIVLHQNELLQPQTIRKLHIVTSQKSYKLLSEQMLNLLQHSLQTDVGDYIEDYTFEFIFLNILNSDVAWALVSSIAMCCLSTGGFTISSGKNPFSVLKHMSLFNVMVLY